MGILSRTVAGLAAIVLATPAFAVEDALKVRLVYTRAADAEACDDEDALKNAVRARLGFDPFSAAAPTTVQASVGRRGKELTALVRVVADGPPLERTLASSGADCTELSAAVALTISLAIDPLAAAPKPPKPEPQLPQPTAPSLARFLHPVER